MKFYSGFYPEGLSESFTLKIGNMRVTKSLGLLFTNHCNAECSFCCKSSSPRDKRSLTTEKCIQLINEAKDLGFEQIGFSGGEVMMDYPKLLQLTKECSELGLSFTLATNGFWAKNKEIGRQKLLELKRNGLVLVQASFDESHSTFISQQDFKNLLELSIEENVYLEIHSSYFKDGKRLIDYFTFDLLSKFKVHETPSVRAGRANSLPESLFEFSEEIPDYKCPMPFQLTVDYDSKVYPCCSVSGFNDNLVLGDVNSTSVATSMENIKKSFYLYYIQRNGFKKILEEISKEDEIKLPNFLSVCDVCHYVGSNSFVLNSFINKADSDIRDEILSNLENISNT